MPMTAIFCMDVDSPAHCNGALDDVRPVSDAVVLNDHARSPRPCRKRSLLLRYRCVDHRWKSVGDSLDREATSLTKAFAVKWSRLPTLNAGTSFGFGINSAKCPNVAKGRIVGRHLPCFSFLPMNPQISSNCR